MTDNNVRIHLEPTPRHTLCHAVPYACTVRSCGPLILCRLLPFFLDSTIIFVLCCLVSIFSIAYFTVCPISIWFAIVIRHATAVFSFISLAFVFHFFFRSYMNWLCLSIVCHFCCPKVVVLLLFVCRACHYIFGCILCVCVLFCMLNYFMFIVFIYLCAWSVRAYISSCVSM